jgi:alkylation response protein AidB-like acyl-CoA dehydrogenase
MPGTSPLYGFSKVALTMARLIVDGEDRGTRFFVVPLCNEREMYRGVESITLPRRSGTHPFDWSITRFHNVQLPPTALISSDPNDLSRPLNPSSAWWNEVWRIPFGTLVIAFPWIPALKATAYTGGRYSMIRCILGKGDKPYPILSFRTQQLPIMHATATAIVMDIWAPSMIDAVMDSTLDPKVRHAFAVITKTTVLRHFQRCVSEVAERCGAQGTYEYNHMAKLQVSFAPSSSTSA